MAPTVTQQLNNVNRRRVAFFGDKPRGRATYFASRMTVTGDVITRQHVKFTGTVTELRKHLASLPVPDGTVISEWTVASL